MRAAKLMRQRKSIFTMETRDGRKPQGVQASRTHMRSSRLGLADTGHETGLRQARCVLAEAGERVGERATPMSIEAPLSLEPCSRPRGSAFVGVRKASSRPHTIRKED